MSWKNLFVTKKDEPAVEEVKSEPKVKSQAPVVPPPIPQTFGTGNASQSLIAKFDEIFEKANAQGLDFFEFIKSLKKMDGRAIDERTKYETVYDTMSTMGLTKDVLLTTGKKYMEIFVEVKQEFEKELSSEVQSKVADLNKQADDVLVQNGQYQAQIEELNAKISENLKRMQQLKSEAAANESTLLQERSDFERTHSIFVNGLQKYITDIETYIK